MQISAGKLSKTENGITTAVEISDIITSKDEEPTTDEPIVNADTLGGKTYQDILNEAGKNIKNAYQYAIEAGYDKSEIEFARDLSNIDNKIEKVADGTEDNLLSLTSDGQVKDSGKKTTDFITKIIDGEEGNLSILSIDGQLQDSKKKLADFAPSGFGLGESPKLISDFNTTILPGWYYVDDITINGPKASSYGDIGSLLVLKHGSRLIQIFCCYAPGGISEMLWFVRGFTGYQFDDWKCVNPALVLGKEYKTTELWNNEPVYMKLVSFGKLPNATSSTVAHKIVGINQVISVSGSTSDKKNIPTMNYDGGSASNDIIDVLIDPVNITIYASRDRSSATANILIRYTKIASK